MVERLKVLVLKPNPFEFMLRATSYQNRFNLISSQYLNLYIKENTAKIRAAIRIKITNVDSALKSRDITLPTLKVRVVKAVVFPVVIYGCEICTVKKAEHQRIDAFKLWCWRRFLRVPWTVRRANQSILSEINPEYLLEGWMLKLKLQYFGYLMQTDDLLESLCCWERSRAEG